MDTLTEDQITQLSQEFDLRAQDDGVIKTEESIEELSGGYRVASRAEGEHPDGTKFVRKTSYTEIKLQQPSTEEGKCSAQIYICVLTLTLSYALTQYSNSDLSDI